MEIRCIYCQEKCSRNGFQSNGCQRYKCKSCSKRQQACYHYNAYKPATDKQIILCTKEGPGIRSTARVLGIAVGTVIRRIISIAAKAVSPFISTGKEYEVDEMHTYVRSKTNVVWIVCALERNTKKIVCFNIGSRSKHTINTVVSPLLFSDALRIYTDGLNSYRSLIAAKIHGVKRFGTNHIERMNLTLRTHLKRLNRKTICYSKSRIVLTAILKIYFWL